MKKFIIKIAKLLVACVTSAIVSSLTNTGGAGFAACLAGAAFMQALDKK